MRHFLQQEREHVIGNLLAHGILLIQHITGVRQVGFHDGDNLFRIDLHIAGTDAIHCMEDRHAIAPRWRARNHNIRQFCNARIVIVIEFNDHFLRPQQPGRRITDPAG